MPATTHAEDRYLRFGALATLIVLAIHVAVRPEHGWVLLAPCDAAAVVTALGVLAGWNRAVAIALVFEVAIGLPGFAIGLVVAEFGPSRSPKPADGDHRNRRMAITETGHGDHRKRASRSPKPVMAIA